LFYFQSPGVRAVDLDRYTGDAASGQRDGSRVHVRYTQASANDNEREWQGTHTDLSELPGLSTGLRR